VRLLIAALLSAGLLHFAPALRTPATQLNNSAQPTQAVQLPAEQPKQETPVAVQPTKQIEQTPVKTEPEPKPVVHKAPEPVPIVRKQITDKERLMQAAGIPESDWAAVDYIVTHESSWHANDRNPDSGAYGLCQALPASKMASAGADYISNPVTQLKWCHSYSLQRYGGWANAMAFWRSSRWW